MFIHLLALICASASVVATPVPEPYVVVTVSNVGGCASGFPVCCTVAGYDYNQNEGCSTVLNVNACGNSTTALCCSDIVDVATTGVAANCTACVASS